MEKSVAKLLMKNLLLFIFLGTIISAQQLRLTQDTLSVKNSYSNHQLILKDSRSNLRFVYTSQAAQSNRSKEIFYAEQSADSFVVTNLTNNNLEDNFPSLSLDKNGYSHISFLGRDTANIFQLKYTNNLNGDFSDPIFLTYDEINKTNPVSIVTPDSIVHLVYFTNSYSENNINYITYNLKDLTVSEPIVLGEGETNGDNEASFALDKKGKLHLVIKTGPASGGKLKYFNTVKGKLQEFPTDIEHLIKFPQIVVDRFNSVNILYKNVYDNRLYIMNNIGGNFGEPVAVTPEDQNPVGFNNFAVDDVGRFYFIYQSSDSAERFNKTAFYLIHGSSKKFSEPIKIQEWTNAGFSGNSASISASGNGQISILISRIDVKNNKTISDLILKCGQIFGNPQIEVASKKATFLETSVGDTAYATIRIQNSGTALLKIYPLKFFNNNFEVFLSDTVYIKPDSTQKIKIGFTPTDTISFKSSIRFLSNAVNAKSINVSLNGKGKYLPKFHALKDTLSLVDENDFMDSLIFMNDGFAPLRIDSIKTNSNFPLNASIDTVTIKPQERVSIFFELDSSFSEYNEQFSDSVIVYSNDPKNPARKFIVQGKQFKSEYSRREEPQNELYQLHQNYPNPFNPVTTISFTLNTTAYVKLGVFDALARQIDKLVDETMPAGTHNITFNGEQLSTGVYYYKLQVRNQEKSQPDYIEVKKMILVK